MALKRHDEEPNVAKPQEIESVIFAKLELNSHGEYTVIPPEGYYASRIGCNCNAISMLPDGSCSCAPHDCSMPVCLKRKTPSKLLQLEELAK